MAPKYQHFLRVELHDVWPSLQDGCRRWLDACRAAPEKVDLLVVPRRGGDLSRPGEGLPESFCAWLREREALGNVLWLHGLTHDAPDGSDAEFRRLDPEEIRQRLELGRRDWNESGLAPFAGFCPPCWKASCNLSQVAAQEGLRATASRWGLRENGTFRLCPAITSFGGNGLLAWLWNRSLPLQVRLLELGGIPWRLVLHPQDHGTAASKPLTNLLQNLA